MNHSLARFAAVGLALAPFALLMGCPKKEEPVTVQEAAAPPPAPTPEAAPLVPLQELVDDAGADADASETGPKKTGTGGSVNVSRIKQCCSALSAEAKRMGAGSLEGAAIQSAAVTCTGLAAQAGASGNAPEFAVIRQMLQGRTLPAVCQGL